MPGNLIISITNYVAEITRYLAKPSEAHNLHKKETLIHWKKPAPRTWKLNTDGSFQHKNCNAACGGLLRDSNGNILQGFAHNLGQGNPLVAELWGVHKGIQHAYSIGIKDLVVELDSKVAFELIVINCPIQHVCAHLTAEIFRMTSLNRNISFQHIFREANVCADSLAKFGQVI